jgi:hypothetical protein
LEKAARTDYLPATAAGRAVDGTRTRLGAGTVALIASVEFADLNLFFRSEGRFFQGDLHVVTQIGTALPFVSAANTAATKETFENPATTASENFAENIEWIVEPAAKSGSPLRKSGVSVPIVSGALIGIDQHIVSFAELLKSLLGVRIIRIFVRMEFNRELAIGALDFILGRTPRDTEHFVIIAFGRWHLKIVMGDV